MKVRNNRQYIILLSLAFLLSAADRAHSWGFLAHGMSTVAAVQRLNGPLGAFFRAHSDFLYCYCVLPDSWAGASEELLRQMPAGLENPAGLRGQDELRHHFLHLDDAPYVWAELPEVVARSAAQQRYRAYMQSGGTNKEPIFRRNYPNYQGEIRDLADVWFRVSGEVPWVIVDRVHDLAVQMRESRTPEQWRRSLLLAAILAHYVGDAHVPLHGNTDFDGRLHRNPLVAGLHARWESSLVARHEEELRAYLAQQRSTPPRRMRELDLPPYLWRTIRESMQLAVGVLRDDDQVLTALHPEQSRPGAAAPTAAAPIYTDAYYRELSRLQYTVVRDRLGRSAEAIARIWDLAWRLAGRPALPTTAVAVGDLKWVDYRTRTVQTFDPRVGHRTPTAPAAPTGSPERTRSVSALGVQSEAARESE